MLKFLMRFFGLVSDEKKIEDSFEMKDIGVIKLAEKDSPIDTNVRTIVAHHKHMPISAVTNDVQLGSAGRDIAMNLTFELGVSVPVSVNTTVGDLIKMCESRVS